MRVTLAARVPDRRGSYRLDVEPGDIRVATDPLGLVRVLDLSAAGGSLALDRATAGRVLGQPVVLHLPDRAVVRARFVPVRVAEHGADSVTIGARLEDMTPGSIRRLAAFLVEQFRRQSRRPPERLSAGGLSMGSFRQHSVHRVLLRRLVGSGQPLHVYHAGLALPVVLELSEFSAAAGRRLLTGRVVSGQGSALDEGQQYTFAFDSHNALAYFTSTVWERAADRLSLTLPPDVRLAGFRSSERVHLDRGAAPEIVVAHPRTDGHRLVRPLLDASARGLSFLLEPERDALFPGERVHVAIQGLGRRPLEAEALIRSIKRRGSPDDLACGLELVHFADAEQADRWRSFVFGVAHRRLELGDEAAVGLAWQGLERSGYLALTPPEDHLRLEQTFKDSWARLAGRRQVTRFFVLRESQRLLGTAAASLIYPDTWMCHLFGIDREERRRDRHRLLDLAGEIYSGMMYLLRHLTGTEHFVFYFDATKAFHEMAFGRFLRRYPRPEDFVYDSFSLYQCEPTAGPDNLPTPTDVELREADPALTRALAQHLEQTLPQVEVEAFCYDEARIELGEFSRACAEQGYERKRRLLFALRDDLPVAVLVAETGDEGLSIFGLFNKCWLLYLEPDAAVDDAVKQALLDAARRYYAQQGKGRFLFLGSWSGEPEDLLTPLGYTHLADGLRWLGRRKMVPAYVNYADELMGDARERWRRKRDEEA